ncbi:MAG: hypothetical protein GY827_12330 [Cytophagales bacterium]|nr:hypothetical protein [Cytophagales bacterium]
MNYLRGFLILISATLLVYCSPTQKTPDNQTPEGTVAQVLENTEKVEQEKKEIWKVETFKKESDGEMKDVSAVVGSIQGKMMTESDTINIFSIMQILKEEEGLMLQSAFSRLTGHSVPLPDNPSAIVKIQKEDGTVKELEQTFAESMLNDTKGLLINEMLSEKAPLKLEVNVESESTTYTFMIDPTGLQEVVDQLK